MLDDTFVKAFCLKTKHTKGPCLTAQPHKLFLIQSETKNNLYIKYIFAHSVQHKVILLTPVPKRGSSPNTFAEIGSLISCTSPYLSAC